MLRQAHSSPKLANLKLLLRVPRFQAVGVLESLWHFTATQAPRGDVGKWTDAEIAAALEWEGDASALIEALVTARWLDRSDRFRLLVHDWPHHADQTVKRSPQVRELGFAQRLASDSLATDASITSDSLVKNTTSASVATQPEPEPEPEPAKGLASESPAAPAKKPRKGDGKVVLEAMTAEADLTARRLGQDPLDLTWTLARQKLISSACASWPAHGHEIGVAVLRGFAARAETWSDEIVRGGWSFEALFAPLNVGKNLQAVPRARMQEPEPNRTQPLPFGSVGGPR